MNLNEGTATIIYAVGSASDETLDVVAQTVSGLHSAPDGVSSGTGGLADTGSNTGWYLAGLAGVLLLVVGGGLLAVRNRVAIPAIDVVARVAPVGVVADTGEFDVPPSVDEVGWYRFGPGLEAEAGSVVIAGHVDGAGQGPGAFFRLRELAADDRIEVVAGDQVREFRVVGREEYDKSEIPLARYFARDGAVRLTLITCGGPFDEVAGRYRDNVVVTAVPA
ncbi:class F sortase [Solwaraspora sp. WMMB762]|uniref:class F sortase n=1 Tax=Solwaraspora sp. WMMB762 TaxID=3404120 RepID=UPI003B96545D